MMAQSLSGSFTLFVERLEGIAPKILEVIVILVLGFILAWVAKFLLGRLLKIIRFEDLCYRIGLSTALARANVRRSSSDIFKIIIYWLVIFFAIILSLSTLNVEVVNELTSSLLLYLPRFFVAVFVLIFGYFLAKFVARALLIALVNAQVKSSKPISLAVHIMILILFVTMGIEQLGIAKGVMMITYAILLAGVVLALALAFGLGGKDIAKDFLEKKVKATGKSKKKPDEFSHI
jgi:Mechanosensitive ion channel, conserved TM helix